MASMNQTTGLPLKDFSAPEVPLPLIASQKDQEDAQLEGRLGVDVLETAQDGQPSGAKQAESDEIGDVEDSVDKYLGRNIDEIDAIIEEERDAEIANQLEGRTVNGADTYVTSSDPCIDFFFQVVPGIDNKRLTNLLARAWAKSPQIALKLMFHLRDIREGKGERLLFYDCLHWLRHRHPRTLLANLRHVASAGYWKDLLTFVLRECLGEATYRSLYLDVKPPRFNKGKPLAVSRRAAKSTKTRRRDKRKRRQKAHNEEEERALAVKAINMKTQREERRKSARRDARQQAINHARAVFLNDPMYQAIHVEVARLFAVALRDDLNNLNAGKSVGLAGKWAPSLECHHDKHTLIASTIAQILYPKNRYRQEGQTYESYACMVRDKYRKEYLVPLRSYLDLAEVKMSAGQWDRVTYERVPSVCMNRNKKNFIAHDRERFTQYLEAVRGGKASIASGALMPHDLVRQAMEASHRAMIASALGGETEEFMEHHDADIETVELQWRSYVDKLKKSGAVVAALPICDVSGSMTMELRHVRPIDVAIGLSILVAEATEPPFDGLVCTFSSDPELVPIRLADSLVDKVRALLGLNFGMSTNLQRVFDLILQRAEASNLPTHKMIRRLFVFSDMEFDQGIPDAGSFATDHMKAKRKFEAAGYALPEVIYWNLNGAERSQGRGPAVPVLKDERGATLISGFSGQLLKGFLGESKWDEMTPHSTMMAAIEGYDHLIVLD